MSASVQQNVVAGTAGVTGTITITPALNPSALIIFINWESSGGATLSSVSGSRNGSYTLIDSSALTFSSTKAFYVKNTTTLSEVITITFSTSASWAAEVIEVAGSDTSTSSSMIGTHGVGTNTTSGNINTTGNITGSSGDLILAATGNYYTGTWSVGATNPSGMAEVNHRNGGTGAANVMLSAATLSGSYAAKVGNATTGTVYGNTIGVQIIAAGGGATGNLPAPVILQQAIPRSARY